MHIKLGLALRTMGDSSAAETLLAAARAADQSNIDDIWIQDHIAIPPDDAEGSKGRYLDPFATLGWLAAATERVGLGTAALVLPYRSALPTAKSLATVQELSGGRLLLGIGVGWMQPEFTALGLARRDRGRDTDRTLDLLRRCFEAEDDVVKENGQKFLFRPHPPTPPIYIGGMGPHALERTVRYGDGWMPMGSNPEKLAPEIGRLHTLAEQAGRPRPEVISLAQLPLTDPGAAAARLHNLMEIGVTRFIHGDRYQTADEFARLVEAASRVREALD